MGFWRCFLFRRRYPIPPGSPSWLGIHSRHHARRWVDRSLATPPSSRCKAFCLGTPRWVGRHARWVLHGLWPVHGGRGDLEFRMVRGGFCPPPHFWRSIPTPCSRRDRSPRGMGVPSARPPLHALVHSALASVTASVSMCRFTAWLTRSPTTPSVRTSARGSRATSAPLMRNATSSASATTARVLHRHR